MNYIFDRRTKGEKRQPLTKKKKTGTTIAVKFQKIYLSDSVIRRILLNCPSYLFSLNITKESPDSKRI